MTILVTGGSASGKSSFAEQCLVKLGEKNRIYVATMIPWDEECRHRIKKHRAMRKEKGFTTVECPLDLEQIEIPAKSAVLLECMSNLTANEMFREDQRGTPLERILAGVRRLMEQAEDLVVVTNEVFCDGIEYDPGTREYQKLLGNINGHLAHMADEVYEVVCGIALRWKADGDFPEAVLCDKIEGDT